MVQAHSTSSQFLLMIQAHESHWGKFESRGLKGQEVCLVKLQWFKVDKKKACYLVCLPQFPEL